MKPICFIYLFILSFTNWLVMLVVVIRFIALIILCKPATSVSFVVVFSAAVAYCGCDRNFEDFITLKFPFVILFSICFYNIFFHVQDKWRNMSVSFSGQGSREKSRTPKLKALPAIPVSSCPGSAALTLVKDDGVSHGMDSSRNSHVGKVPGCVLLFFSLFLK